MARRELRKSLKADIDNLFKSPEQAESDFQRATKRPRKQSISESPKNGKASSSGTPEKDKNQPKIMLRLCRFEDGHRIDSENLAHFIHFVVFGSSLQKPKWVTVSNHRNILQTLVIRINVEEDFFETTNLSFPNEFFEKKWLELDADISDRSLFWSNLMNVRLTLPEQIRRKAEKMQKTFDELGKHDKTHFVLSTSQMAERNYPFPGEEDIVPTKRKYQKLSATSPMFSVDCEMCETTMANRALTRISIIDEHENTILDTLVKPAGQITNYLTQYSGITEKMMDGVTTTLEDVQRAVQSLLPPDAILVGHSLEFDLQAMKMTHPYCLDVGHVLNYTNGSANGLGFRNSLKNLAELFLDEQIQSKFGHCSYEDAWAALRLAQLKLKKGLMFGNTSYGWNYPEFAKNQSTVKVSVSVEEQEALTFPCSGCSQPTVVGCSVVKCRCRLVTGPAKCVHCIKTGESVQGDFDWAESLDVDAEERAASPIGNYLKKDKLKTVMCAFEMNRTEPVLTKKIRSKPPSAFPSYDRFLDSVASEMLNDSLVLLEIDKEKVEPLENVTEGEIADNSEALNQKLEKLVGATARTAMIMMIFSSPKKNILYVRVK